MKKIRKALPKDIAILSKLIPKLIEDIIGVNNEYLLGEAANYLPEKIEAHLSDKSQDVLLIEVDKEIIGFCHTIYLGGTCWIEGIGVKEEYRKNNYASDLLRELEKNAKNKNAHLVWANIIKSNKPSIALAKSLGFVKVVDLNNHYYNLDFILFRKYLKK